MKRAGAESSHEVLVERAVKRLRFRLAEVEIDTLGPPNKRSAPHRSPEYDSGYQDCAAQMKKHQDLWCHLAGEEMLELVRREKESFLSQIEKDRQAQVARAFHFYAANGGPWRMT